MSSEKFLKRKEQLSTSLNSTISAVEMGYAEAIRVRKVVENTKEILDDLDRQFAEKTGLTKGDMAFLFIAIGLQVARQYLLTKFPQRLDDQTAAKQTPGKIKEHSNRVHRYYQPSLEEIITNPVPFDANIGADGALAGGGQLGHRATAIGHDPILGFIFGTANIATSTLTTSSFQSYHIYTNGNGRDYFKTEARTDLVLKYTYDKMMNQGMEGKIIVAASLMKEWVHLKSDLYTKHSLPIPFVSAYNPKLASELASYGLDMANLVTVGKQASYALFINMIIAMCHRLLFDGETDMDKKLYEVRTRKILSYSNLIATSSNLAVVAVTRKMDLLDLGGLAVTIHRLISDRKFIQQVKEEFIFGSYAQMIEG